MTIRSRIVLALLWMLSLVGVGTWVSAQEPRVKPPLFLENSQAAADGIVVISGENLGFRLERYRGKTPIGTIVVRVGGQWVDVESEMKIRTMQ